MSISDRHVKRNYLYSRSSRCVKGICTRVFSVEAPLKVATKSFLTCGGEAGEEKTDLPPSLDRLSIEPHDKTSFPF